jgi:ATP-dependent Clp protease, protease subunit
MFNKDSREVFIYDDIGPSWAGMIGADSIRNAMAELGSGPIHLRINSYGGSVDQALAMIEVLGRHDGEIDVTVDSIAASAASLFPVVFPSVAAKHSRVMIHDPWSLAFGNASEMRKTADILDKYRDSILAVYQQGMTVSGDEIKKMMEEETWFSAEEAYEVGLVGAVAETGKKVDAKAVAPDRFRNTPQDLLDVTAKARETQATPRRIAAALALVQRRINDRKKNS